MKIRTLKTPGLATHTKLPTAPQTKPLARSLAGPFMSAVTSAFLLAALPMAAHAAGQHAGGHHGDASVGEAGRAQEVKRTVQVEMLDTMRFVPATFTAQRNETIRFVVRNTGKLKHEFVLGTKKDLDAHYEVMKKFPEMEHADDNMLSLAPGQTGELIWKFTKAGTVHFACLHPGHYDAGMKGEIKVASPASTTSPKPEKK